MPSAAQVHDLCCDLRFIGKIGEEQKVHVGTKSLQVANSFMTRLIRLVTWESNVVTIKYVRDKTDRAIEFCDQLCNEFSDPDKRDAFLMIREDLQGCIALDVGLDALHKTYAEKDGAASELEVIIRNIKMKLAKYHNLLSLPS